MPLSALLSEAPLGPAASCTAYWKYSVVPEANDSPVNIGTMAQDAWFQGAIGKVAIYDFLLSETQITNHYRVMTGESPTGSCDDTCTF